MLQLLFILYIKELYVYISIFVEVDPGVFSIQLEFPFFGFKVLMPFYVAEVKTFQTSSVTNSGFCSKPSYSVIEKITFFFIQTHMHAHTQNTLYHR